METMIKENCEAGSIKGDVKKKNISPPRWG
jgi:hypothetical protein